jgi:hypothetical protein
VCPHFETPSTLIIEWHRLIGRSPCERQYASFGRIAGYLNLKAILRALRTIGLGNVTIPLIVPGVLDLSQDSFPIRLRSDLFDPHIIVAPPMRAA